MADFGGVFDATTVEPRAPYEVLAPGWYLCIITKSGFEATKDGSGEYLKVELQVVDGPRKGAVVFDRLNLKNKNDTAVKIARETLSSICHAANKLAIRDSLELHNIPIMVKIHVDPTGNKGEPSNEVKGYKKPESAASAGGHSPFSGASAAPAAPFTPAAGGMPWNRT